MNTNQNKGTKASATSSNPANNWAKATATTVKFVGKNTIEVDNEFGSLMKDPVALNRVRQDLRAWFMAYIPVYEAGYVVSTLENSIHHFEAVDQFLCELVEAGINRQKGGKSNE